MCPTRIRTLTLPSSSLHVKHARRADFDSSTISNSSPGLNYLRLASQPFLAPLDWAILAVQGSMHLFTLVGLEQTGPRALSAVLLGLAGTGALVKRQ